MNPLNAFILGWFVFLKRIYLIVLKLQNLNNLFIKEGKSMCLAAAGAFAVAGC
jgi:hypothetical protein